LLIACGSLEGIVIPAHGYQKSVVSSSFSRVLELAESLLPELGDVKTLCLAEIAFSKRTILCAS
jgi:hypothetical protein